MAARNLDRLVAGVDLGGTKILAAIVNSDNKILGRAKTPTPAKDGGPAILAAMLSTLERAAAEAAINLKEVAGIGVGSPGPLDSERGVILFSSNLNVRDFALGPDLASALGVPVLVQNDVRVGGYGEFRLGAGKGYRNVLAAFVGTGIGGCLIIDGKVVAGSTGNAGEIGHIMLKPGGPKCGCGRHGCMEALASRTAMTHRIVKAVRKGKPTILAQKVGSKNDRLKSKDLAAAYHGNDHVAVAEIARAAHYLGLGLGGLVNVFGPEVVIIGGGVTEALGQPYLEAVRASARMQILVDPKEEIHIELAGLGDDAGVLGGALLARERFAS